MVYEDEVLQVSKNMICPSAGRHWWRVGDLVGEAVGGGLGGLEGVGAWVGPEVIAAGALVGRAVSSGMQEQRQKLHEPPPEPFPTLRHRRQRKRAENPT